MPTLIYFPFGGKAESVRMLLKHAKVDFEDKRVTFEEFGKMKADGSLPNGQVPLWVDDAGVTHNQTNAIIRALGIQHGYYPVADAWAAYEVDWVVEVYNEFWNPKFYSIYFNQNELNEEGIAERVAHFEKMSHQLEKKLAAHGKDFLAGDKITIADFLIFSAYQCVVLNAATSRPTLTAALTAGIEKTPFIQKWLDRLSEDAALKEWLATRPVAIA